MNRTVCRALQCLEQSRHHGVFCMAHWANLPPAFRGAVESADGTAATIKAADAVPVVRGSGSGNFYNAVMLAIRWLAVQDGLMAGPPPSVPNQGDQS